MTNGSLLSTALEWPLLKTLFVGRRITDCSNQNEYSRRAFVNTRRSINAYDTSSKLIFSNFPAVTRFPVFSDLIVYVRSTESGSLFSISNSTRTDNARIVDNFSKLSSRKIETLDGNCIYICVCVEKTTTFALYRV